VHLESCSESRALSDMKRALRFGQLACHSPERSKARISSVLRPRSMQPMMKLFPFGKRPNGNRGDSGLLYGFMQLKGHKRLNSSNGKRTRLQLFDNPPRRRYPTESCSKNTAQRERVPVRSSASAWLPRNCTSNRSQTPGSTFSTSATASAWLFPQMAIRGFREFCCDTVVH